MNYIPIDSKWKCAQGGGLEITVISISDERNLNEYGHKKRYKRTGDVIYVYTHNGKIGSVKQFDQGAWDAEWSLITL